MEIIRLSKIFLYSLTLFLLSCTHNSSDDILLPDIDENLPLDSISSKDKEQFDSTKANSDSETYLSQTYEYIYNAFFYKSQSYCLIGTINQFGKKQFSTIQKGDKIYYTIPDQKMYYSVESEVKFDGDYYTPDLSRGYLLFDSLFYDNNYYVKLYFNPVNKIRTTQAILTDKPLPEQDWTIIKPSENDKQLLSKYHGGYWERIDKIKTRRGIFILAQYNKGVESEFDIHQTFFFEVKDGALVKICDFEDQWNWPYMDIDGDGVPEIIGNTDYKSPVIRKVYPKYEIIAKMDSGI